MKLGSEAETSKVAIVTGASSGIGFHVADNIAKAGYIVYDFSRRGDTKVPEGVRHISVDVTDEASVNQAVQSIIEEYGTIDILVNCAGYGISGAIEFTDINDAISQLDVNFYGVVRCTKAVLGHMRNAGRGRIINISSVAAVACIPFQGFYSVSKSAISTYSMALANEVRPYGITVSAIMPGDIATGFTGSRCKTEKGDAEYGHRISRSVSKMEKDEIGGMKPETAGLYIARKALKKGRLKPLYTLGFSYKVLAFLIKILPCRFVNWAVYQLYAR